MENINYSFYEKENKKVDDIDSFLYDYTLDINDINEMKTYYEEKLTLKELSHIFQYYGLQKNKMVKDEMLQLLVLFESEPVNKIVVERRMRLWQNIRELKTDPFFKKYILF
jgi:hypothetical protein